MALVLILTNQQDIHTDLVLRELLRRGVPVIRLHTDEFPTAVRITYQDDDAQVDILPSGQSFRTSQVSAVWYRRPKAPTIDPKIMDASDRAFAAAESEHMIENLYALLGQALWVNPLLTGRQARSKLLQLRIAKQLGLAIPDTLVTNDPEAARRFIETHRGLVVYKAVRTGLVQQSDGTSKLIFTTKVTVADYERLQSIALTPCTFQELVPKRIEIRATVVDDVVFQLILEDSHASHAEQERDHT